MATEKRRFPRIPHTFDVIQIEWRTGRRHRARVKNFSRGGMYLETDTPVPPGAEVYIGVHEHSPYDSDPDVYEAYHADVEATLPYEGYRGEIRWCRPNPDEKNGGHYAMGIRYHHPLTLDLFPGF